MVDGSEAIACPVLKSKRICGELTQAVGVVAVHCVSRDHERDVVHGVAAFRKISQEWEVERRRLLYRSIVVRFG